ncbi:MAG: SDR family oxidoreductase [Acidobacteria bacterium]|nr:SDR family oxidoreductase [Acidobacteriota bacterium]
MRVFVTGATGYIGSAVAESLKKAGHRVAGLARSEASAEKLRAAGVEPVPGDLLDPAVIGSHAAPADAVIHTAIAWGPDAAKLDEQAVRAILEALAGTKKPFVYTSGVWVIGDTKGRVAGELTPLRPPAIVAWRPAVEKLALDSAGQGIRTVVLRPAMVYGRGGGFVAAMVKQAREGGVVRIVGSGENHWSFVHLDALAELYVRAAEQAPAGELFLASDGPAFTVREVAGMVASVYGARVEQWPLEEARKELGLMADALVMDQKIMSTKAGRMLGWGVKAPLVLDEIRSGSYAPSA